MIEFVHHYTTVETLEKILRSGKLRLNRLDKMDDVREEQIHHGINFGKYFFASCWTYAEKESIPQWELYAGGMRGVRITLPVMPFKTKLMRPDPAWGFHVEGDIYSPLSFREMFGPGYMVLPMFMAPDQFCGPVEYRDDAEARYASAIELVVEDSGRANLTLAKPFDLVRLKSRDWEFQKEFRYFLFVMPSLPIPETGPGTAEFYERLPSFILDAFLSGKGPGIEHLDLDIADDALSQLKVTMGPLSSEESKRTVEGLVGQHAPHAKVVESSLKGAIRERKA